MAFLSETWLSDSPELLNDIDDLEMGTGYGLLCKNCLQSARGYSTGGVAIAYQKADLSLKVVDMPGNDYEFLFAVGSMPRFSRIFLAICAYLPPGLPASSVDSALCYLVDAILELKSRFKDPFITISGDCNNYHVSTYLANYPDISLLLTGPTRGDRTLDLIFTNFPDQITQLGTLDPLEDDSNKGFPSDHLVVFCSAELPRFQAYEWTSFSYMRQTE